MHVLYYKDFKTVLYSYPTETEVYIYIPVGEHSGDMYDYGKKEKIQ